MRYLFFFFVGLIARIFPAEPVRPEARVMTNDLYAVPLKTLRGKETSLSEYKGKVLLIVNTASKCGLTPQYAGLEKLYLTYKDRGLVVLGFPSNDFLAQEPGSAEQIEEFCQINYGVSFPLYAKNPVKGADKQPLYQLLTQAKAEGPAGEISWNFEKFLVDREGRVKIRFSPKTSPEDKAVIEALESLL